MSATAAKTVVAYCNACGRPFDAAAKYAGSTARCPKCGKIVNVPADLGFPEPTSAGHRAAAAAPELFTAADRIALDVAAIRTYVGWLLAIAVLPLALIALSAVVWLLSAAAVVAGKG